ncbi:hypothetical protein HDU78_004292 [Chytriomyces hyalinus]|nr:hypothetical protein HDU78_004292 [Chytriomyces hyalinus]
MNLRCYPAGATSIWSTFSQNLAQNNDRKLVVVTAQADANGFFQDFANAAAPTVSGYVTLLAAAQALSENQKAVAALPSDILFTLFSSESFGFAGSQHFVKDISAPFTCKQEPKSINDSSSSCGYPGAQCQNPCHISTDFKDVALTESKRLLSEASYHDANVTVIRPIYDESALKITQTPPRMTPKPNPILLNQRPPSQSNFSSGQNDPPAGVTSTRILYRKHPFDGDETVAPCSSADLVRLAANKRVTLLGDSMTNQVFEALYGDTEYLGITVVEKDLRHKFQVDDNETGSKSGGDAYKYHYREEKFAMTPSTANYSLIPADNITDPFGMDDLMVTRRKHMQWMIDQSDITGKLFLLRDILPTNTRDLVHDKLCGQKTYRYDQENALLQKLAKKYELPFVRTEQFYFDKGHAKVGVRYETKKTDCLHYCMNRFIYASVINALYEAIYTELHAQSLPTKETMNERTNEGPFFST